MSRDGATADAAASAAPAALEAIQGLGAAYGAHNKDDLAEKH